MFRIIKSNTNEPRYLHYTTMDWFSVDDGYFYSWETDEEKATLFATKQEVMEILWYCGFHGIDVIVEKV